MQHCALTIGPIPGGPPGLHTPLDPRGLKGPEIPAGVMENRPAGPCRPRRGTYIGLHRFGVRRAANVARRLPCGLHRCHSGRLVRKGTERTRVAGLRWINPGGRIDSDVNFAPSDPALAFMESPRDVVPKIPFKRLITFEVLCGHSA